MAPAFVFAEQVRKFIRSGKKKFNVPQGARISAAAMELINDRGIEIHTLSSGTPPTGKGSGEKTVSPDAGLERKRPAQTGSEKVTTVNHDDEPSKELVEDIVNRVIERFYQLKGTGSSEKAATKRISVEKEAVTNKDDDLVICRCEEITKEEIRDTIKNGFRTLNGIKRVTRAGMGLCQGQTCQRLITQILAEELGVKPADIEPTTARGPVRPIRLAVFANS